MLFIYVRLNLQINIEENKSIIKKNAAKYKREFEIIHIKIVKTIAIDDSKKNRFIDTPIKQ